MATSNGKREIKNMRNILKLFRTKQKDIKFIRVSVLAGYYYCAVRAWCQARGIDSPKNEALTIGKEIHDEITAARHPSVWEQELEECIKQYMVELDVGEGSTGLHDSENKVFMREWNDGDTAGYIVTHGFDDWECNSNKEVTLIEYKTTASKSINNFKVCTALFQLKLYMWILNPLLKAAGYKIVRGKIIYLGSKGKDKGKFIDERIIRVDESDKYAVENWADDWYVYNTKKVESDIANILDQFRHPEKLIPPAKWKCYGCYDVFKKECPFQGTRQ